MTWTARDGGTFQRNYVWSIFRNLVKSEDHLTGAGWNVGEKRGEPMMSLRSCNNQVENIHTVFSESKLIKSEIQPSLM